MTTIQSPVFTTEAGAKLSRITTNRQLQKFLSRSWEQKSLRIDGAPGLTIHQSGRWHFNLMANGQRLSTTLGRYPEVSLAEARSKALSIRQNFVETGTRPNQKKISGEKHANPSASSNSNTITIDSLLPEYLHYRYNELLEGQTNKHPDKAVLVMEARYRKHLAPLIGKLHPRQLNNQLVIACLAPIASRKAERTKCLGIVSGLAKWFLLR